ncbi:hypothetical protein SBV1_580011 [Verrucomicrobia bacterium]|nr:hypothetical protein SBV1_580011 [Verrucomicrobiota bacterium]
MPPAQIQHQVPAPIAVVISRKFSHCCDLTFATAADYVASWGDASYRALGFVGCNLGLRSWDELHPRLSHCGLSALLISWTAPATEKLEGRKN